MHLVFVTPQYFASESYLGGGERYPSNTARAVSRASDGAIAVEIVSFGPRARVIDVEPSVSIRVLEADLPGDGPLDVLGTGLGGVLARADAVHVHQPHTRAGLAAIVGTSMLNRPLWITDHGGRSSSIDSVVPYLDLATGLICQSSYAADRLQSRAPKHVVPGGVDTDVFSPGGKRRDYVLFVGRLLPHKGIDRLISALPPGLPLVVCGREADGAYASHLRTLARGKDVAFVHDADDDRIVDLYRCARATVLPSVNVDGWGRVYDQPELMGLTPLESMACGTPAIVAAVGAMPEFVEDGRTGFVIDSIESLQTRLAELRDDACLATRLGREAREHVVARFGLDVVGPRLVDVYLGAER